jgi:hypothetical protein
MMSREAASRRGPCRDAAVGASEVGRSIVRLHSTMLRHGMFATIEVRLGDLATDPVSDRGGGGLWHVGMKVE